MNGKNVVERYERQAAVNIVYGETNCVNVDEGSFPLNTLLCTFYLNSFPNFRF